MTRSPTTLDVLDRLVGFDTVSSRSNLALIDYVRALVEPLGARVFTTFDDTGRKANLLASIGDPGRPALLLSGHSDVVPVEDQAWTGNPFALRRMGDRVVGRGACDMKGFLATAIATLPRMIAADPGGHVAIAVSYDEEVGCLGVGRLIEDLVARALPVRGCIVGEPTGMHVVNAHKGKVGCHVEVTGREGHSSQSHLCVNALEASAEAIAWLTRRKRSDRTDGPHDPRFEEPRHTTIEVCRLSSGTAVNVVPNIAAWDFDIRHLPGQDPGEIIEGLKGYVRTALEPAMKAVDPAAGFRFALVPGCLAFEQTMNDEFARATVRLLDDPNPRAVGFGTEAGHFRAAGIPTLVCGPGDIAEAHRPDESITLDQLETCERFLIDLAGSLAVP